MDFNRNFSNGFDNSEGQMGLTIAEEALPILPVPLHPFMESRPAAEREHARVPTGDDQVRAIDAFAHAAVGSLETDYGDWMRIMNKQWLDLSRTLKGRRGRIHGLLQQMHWLIQFDPSWRPIETARTLVSLALEMRQILGATRPLTLEELGLAMTENDPPLVIPFARPFDQITM